MADHTLTIRHDGERYVMTVDDQKPWQTVFAWALLQRIYVTLALWTKETAKPYPEQEEKITS